MQKVEEYVGVPIFNRAKNKLSLNDAGKEVVKYANFVIEAERTMKERAVYVYNSSFNLYVGSVAPGPMIKYGNLLFSTFPHKQIISKIEPQEDLINKLLNGNYDFIFTYSQVDNDLLVSQLAFQENLYVTVPRTCFLAGVTNGVHFSEIDGQSFLVSNNLGIWDNIVSKNLPKSKFFLQDMGNLYNIVNASTIPNFSTNITLPLKAELDRISLPILDDEAKVTFYLVYRKQDKRNLNSLLKLIMNKSCKYD